MITRKNRHTKWTHRNKLNEVLFSAIGYDLQKRRFSGDFDASTSDEMQIIVGFFFSWCICCKNVTHFYVIIFPFKKIQTFFSWKVEICIQKYLSSLCNTKLKQKANLVQQKMRHQKSKMHFHSWKTKYMKINKKIV